jgi:cold shock CspA family protein
MMNDIKKVIGNISFLSEEGWGFILSKEIEFERIFFHWTGLTQDTARFKSLEKYMKVEFVPIELPGKGFRAIKIRVVNNE